MRRKLAVAALFVGALLATLTPTPAYAAAGGNIYHAADSGYNHSFNITCYGGGVREVYEGQSSNCPYGTTAIYVYAGQEVWCYHPYVGWTNDFDATGSHNTAGWPAMSCVSQAD